MTEFELLNRIIEGETDLFAKIVNKYQVQIKNICLGYVHDKEKADDIAQEVFIEIWKSLKKFKQKSKFSTWIYRIAVNKSLNYIRKEKKYSNGNILSIENTVKDIQIEIKEEENPDFEIENNEKSMILNAAINRLSKKQKNVFVLNKLNDISYKEISEITGYSLSSIESLIHRAKLKLQSELINYYKKN